MFKLTYFAFDQDMHDFVVSRGETKDVFPHEDAVYGLSPDPTNPHVFASACDDGRILIFDTRDSLAGMITYSILHSCGR